MLHSKSAAERAMVILLIAGGILFLSHTLYLHLSRKPLIYWEWPSQDGAPSWKISPGVDRRERPDGIIEGILQNELNSLEIRREFTFSTSLDDMMAIRLKVKDIPYEGEENRAIWRKRGWFIHWLNDGAETWHRDRRATFYPYQDEAWHTYFIPLGREPGWKGKITAIRIFLQRIPESKFYISSVSLGRNLHYPTFLSRLSRSIQSAFNQGKCLYLPLFSLLLICVLVYWSKKRALALIYVFLLALIIRALFILDPSLDGMVIGDQARLDIAAQKIAGGKDLMGDIFWPPVWQYLLAGIYWVFGHSYPAVRIFLAFSGALTCVALYQFGKEVLGPRTGLLAGVFLALSAGSVFYSGFLFTDSFNALLTTAAFLLLHYALKPDSPLSIRIGTGMLMGIAALTRSEMMGFFPVLFLLFFISRKRVTAAVKNGLILCAFAAVMILPKTVLNYAAYDRYVPINIGLGMNFYLANNPVFAAWRSPVMKSSDRTDPENGRPRDPYYRDYPNRIDRHKALMKATFEEIRQRPDIFLKNVRTKFIDFFISDARYFNDRSSLPFTTRAPFSPMIHLRPLFILSFFSLLFIRRVGPALIPPVLYILYYGFVHAFFLLDPRYYLAVIPFLCLCSSACLTALFNKIKERTKKF